MIDFHNKYQKNFTLALFKVPNPHECGIVEIDHNLSIVSFTEKPEDPVSNLAFAGIMIGSPRLMDNFPDRDFFDLGHDVLPQVVGDASGYIMDDYLLDIGTSEKLAQAENDIKNGIIKLYLK